MFLPHERLGEISELFRSHEVSGLSFYEVKGRGCTKKEPVSVGRGVSRPVPEFSILIRIETMVPDANFHRLYREPSKSWGVVLRPMEKSLCATLSRYLI